MAKNRTKGFAWVAVAGACLMIALVGTVVLGQRDTLGATHEPLVKRLPKEIGGWIAEDLPLGSTEVLEASQRLLNYDDYIYRVYRKDGQEVFLYAMYWKQGSISTREIAGHTPDGCWISNGARFAAEKRSERFLVGSQRTVAAERREFVFPHNQRVSAVWWHFWGDDLVDRGFDQKSLIPTLREMWVWLGKRKGQKKDQLLVRVHSTGHGDDYLQWEPVSVFLGQFPQVFNAQKI